VPTPSPWFRDLPLDWTRAETKAVRQALESAYPTNAQLLALAKDAGLAVASLNQGANARQLLREVLEKARLSKRLEQLLVVVFDDPEVEAVHDILRQTLTGYESLLQAAALVQRPSLEVLGRTRSTNSVVTRPEQTAIRSRHGATVSARDLGRASRALARERTDSSGLREGARAECGPAAALGLAAR
jgi:hypothetical protein